MKLTPGLWLGRKCPPDFLAYWADYHNYVYVFYGVSFGNWFFGIFRLRRRG